MNPTGPMAAARTTHWPSRNFCLCLSRTAPTTSASARCLWAGALLSASGSGASVGIASTALEQIASRLHAIEQNTGLRITLDIEPEPGCAIETSEELVGFSCIVFPLQRARPWICDATLAPALMCATARSWASRLRNFSTLRAIRRCHQSCSTFKRDQRHQLGAGPFGVGAI